MVANGTEMQMKESEDLFLKMQVFKAHQNLQLGVVS